MAWTSHPPAGSEVTNISAIYRELTDGEIEYFFRVYLGQFGLDGGWHDFAQMNNWYMTGYYEDCFQKIWPIPMRYGYSTPRADRLRAQVLDSRNFAPAVNSYRAYIAKKHQPDKFSINTSTGQQTKIV